MTLFTSTTEPTRDRWGRPIIDGVTYTRVSTLAKALDDTNALLKWGARQTAIGLSKSHDLIALAATTDPTDKTTLNKIVSQAQERAASTAAASIGTAIHKAIELLDLGQDTTGLPQQVMRDARAYQRATLTLGLQPLAVETFVVCDQVGAAGTFDRLYQGPTRALIGDLKTSANPDAHKWAQVAWAIQLAVYAHGKPWLPGRGIATWADVNLPEPDHKRGVIVHVQQGTGQVRIWSVDIEQGWVAAQIAMEVLAARRFKPITEIPIPTPTQQEATA